MGEAIQSGVLVTAGALQLKGTCVRLTGRKFIVTDGPYIELRELMGGWAVLRVKSLDEAIQMAAKMPQARSVFDHVCVSEDQIAIDDKAGANDDAVRIKNAHYR